MENEKKIFSEILLGAMKSKGFTVEKLAQATGISDRFIESLLGEEFEKLPSSPYVRGYLMKISETLELNGSQIWEEFLENGKRLRSSGFKDELPGNRFAKKTVEGKLVIAGVIILVILSYAGFQIQSYFSTPNLDLEGFEDNMIVKSEKFHVAGKVDPKHQIFLNGEQLYPDDEGMFEKDIYLQSGFNTLNFRIKKFLGREYEIQKQVFLNTKENIIPTVETNPNIGENNGESE